VGGAAAGAVPPAGERIVVGALDPTPMTPEIQPRPRPRPGLGSMPTPHVPFSPMSGAIPAPPVSFASRALPGVSGELERLVAAARAARASDLHLVAERP